MEEARRRKHVRITVPYEKSPMNNYIYIFQEHDTFTSTTSEFALGQLNNIFYCKKTSLVNHLYQLFSNEP